MIEVVHNFLYKLFGSQRIHVIPFTITQGKHIKIFCIIIKTKISQGTFKQEWSKLAFFDENHWNWFWVDTKIPVNSSFFGKKIKELIESKIEVDYLLN